MNGSSRFSSPAGYNTWLDYWEAKAVKPQVDVLPQTVTRVADGIWSVLMFKKYTAMTIAGILCLSVEAVTLAPTSFMLTRLWFQYQAISNIKRFY